MNADQLVVFDTEKRQVIANLDGFKRVHGVIAVPEIGRVYASVTGEHQVAAVDMSSLKTIAMSGPVNYPDRLAYSPATKRGGRPYSPSTESQVKCGTELSLSAPEIFRHSL